MTGEEIRDSYLKISGLFPDNSDGPPVWPELPQDVLDANPACQNDNEAKTKGRYPSEEARQFCHRLLLIRKRNTQVPLLETFDQPDNSVPCVRCMSSIAGPQSLSLLNSLFTIEACEAFAKRIEQSTRDVRE